MELTIRDKWISLRESGKVKDLKGNDVLNVQGKFWTFTKKKFIKTLDGEVKYIVRNKFWTLFHYKAYVLSPDGKVEALLTNKIFSLHDRYLIDTKLGKLEIKGNILGYDYHILLNDKEVGHVARKVSLRDSFVLSLDDDQDMYFFVALVVALGNISKQKAEDTAAAMS